MSTKTSTASNILDLDALNERLAFVDKSADASLMPVTASLTYVSTPATQRIGLEIERVTVVEKSYEETEAGGSRLGTVTVFGENSDTSVIDMYRQGKNVITMNHLAKGILPYISINTQKIMEIDGTVRHQMQNEEYGQGSLHKVFDDVKNKIRPFEDYPGKLDPVAFVESGNYIMQYMIINDLTRDLDQYIDPDTMDGVIEVFEIRRRNANTNSADIQINGIRCDLSTGDWNFDQKGSSVIDTKYEKVQGVYDWYEDSQESIFPETLFERRLGMPLTGAFVVAGRTLSLDGFIADGYYNIAPFNDTENYIGSSYEHVRYALSTVSTSSIDPGPVYSFNKTFTTKLGSYEYDMADDAVAVWTFTGSLADDGSDTWLNSAKNGNTITLGVLEDVASRTPHQTATTPSAVISPVYTHNFKYGGSTSALWAEHHSSLSFGDGSTDSPFSITAWIRLDSTAMSSNNTILHKGGSASNYQYRFTCDSGRLKLFLGDASASTARIIQQSTNTLSHSTWYHVAATYNGSSLEGGMKIYIDGAVEVSNSTNSGGTYVAMESFTGATDGLAIGGTVSTLYSIANIYDGNMAEIQMWEKELSAAEVLTLASIKDGIQYDPVEDPDAVKALNNILTSSYFDISDIGSRFTSANTGFIFPKNIVSASNVSGISNHLGVDSIAFGGFLK